MRQESWIYLLFISLLVLLGIVLYRKLIQYLSRKRIKTEDYCDLYDLELKTVSGEVEFYFTVPKKRFIQFEILDSDWKLLKEVAAKEFEEGGHIVRLDSNQFVTGTYYYGIRTAGQVLHKKFRIEHE